MVFDSDLFNDLSKHSTAQTLINTGENKGIQDPLSPPLEYQKRLKRCKTYDLQRFFIGTYPKKAY